MIAMRKVRQRMPATDWLRESELANTPIATKKRPETAMKR
jgi:hypothetical protein